MPGQIYISTMQIMTMIVHSVAALAFSRKSATHRLNALSRDPRAPHGEGAALLG
jgi:hypothetical protein